jgi:tRNA pseudouridine55 synthase
MPDKVIKVYKKCGETPLECINTLKKDNESLRFLPMTYAGRLDPLAEGVLLILIGDECVKKDEYLNLPKEYEVEVLFGFSTDTYDVMGKVTEKVSTSIDQLMVKNILPQFVGRIKQKYPPYSSRTVNGQPLFKWARDGKLGEIEIPTHDVFVESIDMVDNGLIEGDILFSNIKEKLSKVTGDFRQKEILTIWRENLIVNEKESYPFVKLRISCGSGVYVRGIAHEIGEKLGIPALALKIVRTKVGEYSI